MTHASTGSFIRYIEQSRSSLRSFLTRKGAKAEDTSAIANESIQGVIAVWREITGDPRKYLFKAARNRFLSAVRREAALKRGGGRSRSIDDPAPDGTPRDFVDPQALPPEQVVLRSEELRRLDEAIEKLPSAERDVLRLHRLDSLTLDETAEALGITRGRVRTLLLKALNRLEGLLGKDYE